MSWKNYPFYIIEDAIDLSLLDEMFYKWQSLELTWGTNHDYIDYSASSIRRSKIAWLNKDIFNNFYDSVWDKIVEANEVAFNLDITQLEPIQFAEYNSEYNGQFDWHVDIGIENLVNRKLSFSLQLTNPSEYTGGDLEFFNGAADAVRLPRTKNTLVVFPSTSWHRVTEVTQGTRHSLTGWVNGPRFR